MMEKEETVELLEDMVRMLVDEPDAVSAQVSEGNGLCVLQIKVAAGDVGKVIGKNGRTANALRTILTATGRRQQTRYDLNIVDERVGTNGPDEIPGSAHGSGKGLPNQR